MIEKTVTVHLNIYTHDVGKAEAFAKHVGQTVGQTIEEIATPEHRDDSGLPFDLEWEVRGGPARMKVQRLNYATHYAYAPPTIDARIELDNIDKVWAVETRRPEPCVRIRFKDGRVWTVIGTPEKFT